MIREEDTVRSIESGGTDGYDASYLRADVRQLAEFRLNTYQLMALTFGYPEGTAVSLATQSARALLSQSQWVSALGFYAPWKHWLVSLERLSTTEVAELQKEYISLFGGSRVLPSVSLYESAYLEPAVAESGQVIADLEREYAALDLAVSPGEGESPDHISTELEFLAVLCEWELEAWDREDWPGGREAITRQIRFLEGHLCRWVPSMARSVASHGGSLQYPLTTEAVHAITSHDADFLAGLLVHLKATEGV